MEGNTWRQTGMTGKSKEDRKDERKMDREMRRGKFEWKYRKNMKK